MGDAMIRTLSRLAAPVLAIPRSAKRFIVLLLDVVLCVLAAWLAVYLRLGSFEPFSGPVIWMGVVSVALALPIFITAGLYRATQVRHFLDVTP
jgi:FlaA1/EpsC-like NDP-sugar epimerase